MTFNRETTLRRCLDSIVTQTLDSGSFEVVLVDVSTNPVTTVLQEFKDRLNVRHFHTPNKGVAGNRNFGARNARAGLLAYIDDDCVAERWLRVVAVILR